VKIPVKTQWQSKIAIRSKFIEYAKAHKETIYVEHQHQVMTIPCSKIDELTVGASEKPVKDIYGKQKDYLIYFMWNPDPVIQKEMIL
jgi:hypothetical protein